MPTHCLVAFVSRTDEGRTDAGRATDLPAYHCGCDQPGQLFHSALSLD